MTFGHAAAPITVAVVLATILAGCGDRAPNHRPAIQEELYRAAEAAGVGAVIRIAEVFPEDWDTVVIWDGYVAQQEGPLVFGPEAVFDIGAHGEDAVVALGLNGRLVAWDRVDVDQPHLQFETGASGTIMASRESAVFDVLGQGFYGEGLTLRLSTPAP